MLREMVVRHMMWAREARINLSAVARNEESHRQSTRRIVMAKTRGNLAIQFGRYATRRDLDRKFEDFKRLNFDVENV